MQSPIRDLTTKGFVTVPYPKNIREAVEKTVESWKKFCELPTEIKGGLPYSNNSAGIGYELKEGIGPKADKKENFDVMSGGREWLEEHIGQIANPIALKFVENAIGLVELITPLAIGFAQESEKAFGIAGFKSEVESSKDIFFVRFIHYFGDRSEGEETASAHADQSGFTLHLFESAPGLQCLTYDKSWIDMPVSEGETVIIPAMQMQLRSEGKLQALAHRVVATPETARNGRYSAVCFVALANTPRYDKDRHGRLQEKEPGFNYELAHEEFSKFFKQ